VPPSVVTVPDNVSSISFLSFHPAILLVVGSRSVFRYTTFPSPTRPKVGRSPCFAPTSAFHRLSLSWEPGENASEKSVSASGSHPRAGPVVLDLPRHFFAVLPGQLDVVQVVHPGLLSRASLLSTDLSKAPDAGADIGRKNDHRDGPPAVLRRRTKVLY